MARSSLLASPMPRIRAWLDRWGDVVPLLLAEFIVWLGFGALLPVLPLYFTEQGVDLALLGLVIAAWPAARLVGEPIFGYLADRTARVPLMVIGLVATGIFSFLPLVFTGPLAFVLLRAGSGLATAAYDPAARGYLTDATPPDRRGEAFGLYGAVQMGGLLLGPAIGALGALYFGGISFVFVFGAVAAFLAAIPIGLRGRETEARTHPAPAADSTQFPPEAPSTTRRAATAIDADRGTREDAGASVPSATLEPGPDRGPGHQRGRLLRGRDLRGHLEPLPPEARGRPRPDRADVRDVRAAGAAVVAVRRPGRRPARLAGVHRHRVDPAGGHGPRVHADLRSAPGRPDDPHRGDRVRDAQPGALCGRRGELADRAVIDGAGHLRRGRDGRLHRRLADRRRPRPGRTSSTRCTCSARCCWRASSSGC